MTLKIVKYIQNLWFAIYYREHKYVIPNSIPSINYYKNLERINRAKEENTRKSKRLSQ